MKVVLKLTQKSICVTDRYWKAGMVVKPVNKRSYEIINKHGNIIRRNNALLTSDKTRQTMTVEPVDGNYHCQNDRSNKPHVADSSPNPNCTSSSAQPNPTETPALVIPTHETHSSQPTRQKRFTHEGPPRRSERLKNLYK